MKPVLTEKDWRDAAIIVVMIVMTMMLPIVIYGYFSWKKFEYVNLSYFVPYELMKAELANPTFAKIFALPLIELNMTSGHILANMYTLTLGQLVLSLLLGFVMGIVFASQLELRGMCEASGRFGAGAAAGTGIIATIAAASTGLLGCCGGSAFAGGVFALAGMGSGTAAVLSEASPFIQLAIILAFVVLYVRQRRTRTAIENRF